MMTVEKSRLDSCLTGIEFPADAATIVECAQGNSCPSDVVSRLQETSARTFNSRYDLYCELGDEQSCHLD